jgi:hypothetical protein
MVPIHYHLFLLFGFFQLNSFGGLQGERLGDLN